MPSTEHAQPSLTAAPPGGQQPDSHYRHLQASLPDWLGSASTARLEALKNTRPVMPSSLQSVSTDRHQALRRLNATHWKAQSEVEQQLDGWRDASTFAEPLLKAQLLARFNLDLDVRATYVRLYVPATTPIFPIKTGARTWTVSLLDAALHNFEEAETTANAYDSSSTFITRPSATGQFDTLPAVKARLSIPAFTRLCRELDLGAKYMTCLEENLGISSPEKASALRKKIDSSEQAALKAALEFARMSGDISETYFQTITGLADGLQHLRVNQQRPQPHSLTMMSAPLTGIIVFAPPAGEVRSAARVVAYVPDDPEHPIKEYASSAELDGELIRQLRSPEYQKFFSRFVNHEHRGFFFSGLNARLSKVTWHETVPGNQQPAWREEPVQRPNLQLAFTPVSTGLWEYIHEAKLNKILNDARVVAVATASVDSKARWALWDSFVGVASAIVQTAALVIAPFVPVLGEMMMAYMAYQFLDEVFEGIVDWAQGQSAEALQHLIGTVESLIQLGMFAAGGAIAVGEFRKVLPKEIVAFLDRFLPVQMDDGQTRYWEADLTRYQQQSVHSRPSPLGLHEHNGKQLLPLDEGHFAVSESPIPGTYRIEHPTRPDAYRPRVRHNGDGAWHTELEQPQTWDSDTALRRIGHSMEPFSPARRARILQVSGYTEEGLRTMHVEQASVPPLLADSITRFKIDQDLQVFIEQLGSELPQHYRAAEPLAQLQLLAEHGRWPADKQLRWVDAQGEIVWQSSGDDSLPVTQIRQDQLIDQDVLKTLLSALDERTAKALLGETFADPELAFDVRTRNLREHVLQLARQQRSALFESRYQASELSEDPLVGIITQHEPALPGRVSQELLKDASGDELVQISEGQLPQRQQELIQLANEQVRVIRAFEGLELDSVSNPDTDTLVLHSLQNVPGWSGDVRLELRDGSCEGKLLDSTGSADAPAQKVLVRRADDRYQPFDERGQELHSPGDIYSSILYALPDTERQALNIQIGQTEKLKSAIRARPLDRDDLRVAISLPPAAQPHLETLRLEGRGDRLPTFGMPDAFAGQGFRAEPAPLEPVQVILRGFTGPDAEAFAFRFNQDPVAIRNELARLRIELGQLQNDLRVWENQVPANNPATGLPLTEIEQRAARQSRVRLRIDLERCWRRELRSSGGYLLQIREPILGDLPVLNADFSHVSMLSINGSAHTGGIGVFLQCFPQLLYLDVQNLHLPDLPTAISVMPTLRNLIVRDCGLVLPTDSRSLFSPLSSLSLLDLQGNPIGAPPDVQAIPSLRYINLENTGITTLPEGLLDHPGLVTGRFDRNRIADIPEAFFDLSPALSDGFSFANNPLSFVSRERVKAFHQRTAKHFGVLPEQADMNRAMNLFPALDVERAAELIYQLPGTLVDGRAQLAAWETEILAMQNELTQWSHNVPEQHPRSGQPLTLGERMNDHLARQAFSLQLEQFWRERSPGPTSPRSSRLQATVEFIGDMPVLSADFSHVEELTLHGNKNVSALQPFLQRLENLTLLDLQAFDLEASVLPSINAQRLLTLRLKNCGIVNTPQTQAALCAMDQLQILDLRGNPLGSFFNLNLLPSLRFLDLSSTGLCELPPGIAESPELGTALFSDNNLTELPDSLFDLPGERSDGIDLADNPGLSTTARNRIKSYYRSTGHDFDVLADPVDIALARELFPSLDSAEASEMIYDLPGTLEDSRAQLFIWQEERSRLRSDLRAWTMRVPTHDPVTGAAFTAAEMYNNYTARSEFAQRLEQFWQSRSNSTSTREDHFSANLAFTGEMPELTVDFGHVSNLSLAGTAGITHIGSFIRLFPNLQILQMRNLALGHMPAELAGLSQLKELTLASCDITFSPQEQLLLQSLSELEFLDLSLNPLVHSPDLGTMPTLNDVRLCDAQLTSLPTGLTDHPNLRNVALGGNALIELPDTFFSMDIDVADGVDLSRNPLSETTRDRIKGHYGAVGQDFGILPDLDDINRAQALFPELELDDITHVIYELPGTLADGSAQLLRWETEITQMIRDLAAWSERVPQGTAGLNMDFNARVDQRQARRAFSQALELFWRSRQTVKPELRLNLFEADLKVIGDLPTLTADFSYVTRLALRGEETLTGVDGFLNCFTGLDSLELRGLALRRLPQSLSRMPKLKTLQLNNCGVVLDASGQAVLSSLSRLTALDLYNNPLGAVPQVSALRALEFIDLSRTGIDQVPSALPELPALHTAVFNDNYISELPEALFQLPADIADGYNLNQNPLSPATRERIKTHHQSQGINFGVAISQEDSQLARSLYPYYSEARLTDMVYSLPGTLAEGHLELLRRQTEITTQLSDLDAWTNEVPVDPVSGAPLQAESLAREQTFRTRFKQRLEHCWRRMAIEGDSEFAFSSELPIMGELPTLTADFSHVQALTLTCNSLTPARVGRFLEGFPNLMVLAIDGYDLGDLPATLPAMANLTALSLGDCRITLTQDTANALRDMTRLHRLVLRNNALNLTPDLSQMSALTRLDLSNTGLKEIPPGLFNRPHFEYASLANNAIVDIPAEIIEADTAEFDFTGNPLSQASQYNLNAYNAKRAATRESARRPQQGSIAIDVESLSSSVVAGVDDASPSPEDPGV